MRRIHDGTVTRFQIMWSNYDNNDNDNDNNNNSNNDDYGDI